MTDSGMFDKVVEFGMGMAMMQQIPQMMNTANATANQPAPPPIPKANAYFLAVGGKQYGLGYGVEVYGHPRVVLDDAIALQLHLAVAHKLEQGVDVGAVVGPLAHKTKGLDKRCDGDVVGTVGEDAHALRKLHAMSDVAVSKVGFATIDAAQQRGGAEDAHRAVGHCKERVELCAEILGQRAHSRNLIDGAESLATQSDVWCCLTRGVALAVDHYESHNESCQQGYD